MTGERFISTAENEPRCGISSRRADCHQMKFFYEMLTGVAGAPNMKAIGERKPIPYSLRCDEKRGEYHCCRAGARLQREGPVRQASGGHFIHG